MRKPVILRTLLFTQSQVLLLSCWPFVSFAVNQTVHRAAMEISSFFQETPQLTGAKTLKGRGAKRAPAPSPLLDLRETDMFSESPPTEKTKRRKHTPKQTPSSPSIPPVNAEALTADAGGQVPRLNIVFPTSSSA